MIKQSFLKIMGDKKRQRFTIPLLAIILSLIVGAVIYLLLGANPITAYVSYLQGSGVFPKANYAAGRSMFTDFMSLLNAWTPMLLASLAVVVASHAGLLNIGVSGQMLLGGLIATVTVGYCEALPGVIAKPLAVLVGVLVGAAAAALMGLLKYKWNINEVVSAIMFNYIIRYVASFFIKTSLLNPVSRQSNPITEQSRLTLMDVEIGGYTTEIPLGVILGILCVILIQFIFNKTKVGFEFRTVGLNPKAAKYSGMNVGRNFITSMAISGGLAGLAGVTYYMGFYGTIQPDVLISTGYDAIAVSILGNGHPIGILLSSFFITIISKGSAFMSSSVGVRPEIASLITGIILLFAACSAFMSHLILRARQKEEDKKRKEK